MEPIRRNLFRLRHKNSFWPLQHEQTCRCGLPLLCHYALTKIIKASFYIPENRLNFPTTKGFIMNISMKLVYQYMAIFFNFSPTSNHLHPLQVENCDSNSRLVVDEDDNGKLRPVRVKLRDNARVNQYQRAEKMITIVADHLIKINATLLSPKNWAAMAEQGLHCIISKNITKWIRQTWEKIIDKYSKNQSMWNIFVNECWIRIFSIYGDNLSSLIGTICKP